MDTDKKISFEDLHGLSQLLQTAVLQVTDVAEEVQRQAIQPPYLPVTPVQRLIMGISGRVYGNVRQVTRLLGGGISLGLKQLPKQATLGTSKHKATLKAVLNGVIGDHLAAEDNPLAQEMEFSYQGKALNLETSAIEETYPQINGKILLFIHGSCMNDRLWKQNGHDHSALLDQETDYTVVHLRYNSGLHIAKNGQQFNRLLTKLLEVWPVEVEELNIVAHSMGGLVSRSAMYYAQADKENWPTQLKKIIFLGTPHQGAPLERIGNYIDQLLGSLPYLRPFARVGKLRSAGITDLRHASLVETDWKGLDRFKDAYQKVQFVPLPKTVKAYAIAGVLPGKASLLGDGLVLKSSALGVHKDASKNLNFEVEQTLVVKNTGHLQLLSSLEVFEKIKEWIL